MGPNLGIMAKVSSRTEVVRLGGSYELVYKLSSQFTLSTVRVNMDVTSRDGVLVSVSTCSVSSTYHVCNQFVACLVHLSQWDVPSYFDSLDQVGKITREQQRWVRGTRREMPVFFRTWEKGFFQAVCMATLNHYKWGPLSWKFYGESTDRRFCAWRVSCQSAVSQTFLWKLSASIWAVGTVIFLLTTWVLILASWSVLCNGQLPIQIFGRICKDWIRFESAERRWDTILDVVSPR